MKLRYLGIGCAASAALAACVTPPTATSIQNSATIAGNFDDVWEKTIGYFAQNNIPIKTLEKDSGLLVAEAETIDAATLDALADCGTGYPGFPGAASYNVFVRDQAGGISVQINSAFSKTFRNAWTGQFQTIKCFSNGTLEQHLLSIY